MRQSFIDDRYLLGDLLGIGGMAKVFLARDQLLNRDVALKILRDQYADNKEFVERFRREAQSAAALNHPNIVSIYDWGCSQDGTYYMAMECLYGGTLKERIASEGPLTVEASAELGVQIAKALQVAHERGVIHRDVKPQNILLNSSSGQAKVADFGIARAVGAMATSALSQTGVVLGTVNYISPEQAMSEPVGPQSDLYSLGVVLYEMLTAKVPFESETLVGLCMKHVNEPPPSPKKVNPRVSEDMEAIVLKLLVKKPGKRYGSAAELAEDLQRVRDGLAPLAAKPVGLDTRVTRIDMQPTVPIPPATTARRAASRRGRSRARASWSLVAGCALLALLGGSGWGLSQNLLGQGWVPGLQGEAPQAQEGPQQDTNAEVASTEETTQAQEPTDLASKETGSSGQAPSTAFAASPALVSAPVDNTSDLSPQPILEAGPAQRTPQPAPDQHPAKEQPAKAQAIVSQLLSYGSSSHAQNGDRTQGQRITQQISGSQKPPRK
jgi:serine/threonine protein kinase